MKVPRVERRISVFRPTIKITIAAIQLATIGTANEAMTAVSPRARAVPIGIKNETPINATMIDMIFKNVKTAMTPLPYFTLPPKNETTLPFSSATVIRIT